MDTKETKEETKKPCAPCAAASRPAQEESRGKRELSDEELEKMNGGMKVLRAAPI